jgi:hypothetical protein
MDKAKIERALRDAIARRGADTAAARQPIYAAARSAMAKNRPGDMDIQATLNDVISTIEETFASPVTTIAGRRRTRFAFTPLPALGLGVLIGAIVAAGLVSAYQAGDLAGGATRAAKLEKLYQNGQAHVPAALDFLRKVVDAVIARQKGDRHGLDTSAKAFISLAAFDPELAKQMPHSLPAGTFVTLRADAFNFKILFNWTLCGSIGISHPEMVDPVRSANGLLGCPTFGLWTPGAANW